MFNFFSLIILICGLLAHPSSVLAFKADTFVPLIHVVDNTKSPLVIPKIIYEESTASAIFNTWMLTPSAIDNATISAFFQKISQNDTHQEIGLFLKTTDNLNLQLLKPVEREQALRQAMENFFTIFGYYPKSVAAATFDAYTLNYLQTKYSVLGAIVLPESAPDSPSSNGAYTNTPFFPSQKDHYVPAKNFQERINLTFSEATPLESLDLKTDLPYYTQKYFNEFTLLNLHTTNISSTFTRGQYRKNIQDLLSLQGKYNLHFSTYSNFSDWFKVRYPESSPASFYQKENSDHSINYLYQSPWYKLEFVDNAVETKLIRLYVYNHSAYEPNIATPSLINSNHHSLDNVLQGQNYSLLKKGGLLFTNYLRPTDFWTISFQNNLEKIILHPNSLVFALVVPPTPSSPLLTIISSPSSITWKPTDFLPFQNTSKTNLLFWFVLVILLIYFLFKKKAKLPILGLALVLISALTTLRSGFLYPFGMGFWGPNGHDAIFHLSIIQKFVTEPFNLSHPQISPGVLTNYHFVFAYLSAFIVKLTSTPTLFFYFVVFQIISGIILLSLLDSLLNQLKLTAFQKNIALVFVFLGSSFGFVLRLLQGQSPYGGESAFWANQAVSMFLNPPFILSLIFLLTFLLIYSKDQKTVKDYLLLTLLGTLLAQTKVYAYILLCLALAARLDLTLFLLVGLGGVLVSLPFSQLGSSPFVFQPLWFLKSMIQSPDRAYWLRGAEAWQAYEAGGLFVRLFILNLSTLVVFILGNLGVRVLGLYRILSEKVTSNLDGLLRSLILISLVLPLVFVQKANPWNSIQFLYFGLFFLSFYTSKYLKSNSFLTYLLVFFGIFGSLGTLQNYISPNAPARLSYQELSALSLLAHQPQGLVLSPLHPDWTYFSAPQPLYDYVSSSYISALSGQKEYLSDTINLEITGLNFHSQANQVKRFYTTKDINWAKEFLLKNNISYIVETPVQHMSFDPANIPLTSIFISDEIIIYKFKK